MKALRFVALGILVLSAACSRSDSGSGANADPTAADPVATPDTTSEATPDTPVEPPREPDGYVSFELTVIGDGTVTALHGSECPGTHWCGWGVPNNWTDDANYVATPKGGSVFHHWEGDCTGTTPTCMLPSAAADPRARKVVAWFTPVGVNPPPRPFVAFKVGAEGAGAGRVRIDEAETDEPCDLAGGSPFTLAGCVFSVPALTEVTIRAEDVAGSRFERWSDGSAERATKVVVQPPPYMDVQYPNVIAVFDSAPLSPRYRVERVVVDGGPARGIALRGGYLAGDAPRPDGTRAAFVHTLNTSEIRWLPAGFEVRGLDRNGRPWGRFARETGSSCAILDGDQVVSVPSLDGQAECALTAVNARGEALGTSSSSRDEPPTPFFFDGTHSARIAGPPGFAPVALDDDGTLAGTLGNRAVRLVNGVAEDVPVPARADGSSVTGASSGRVIGTYGASYTDRAFYWDGTDLFDLNNAIPSFGGARPSDVNGHGVVVGSTDAWCFGCDYTTHGRAFVFVDGVSSDLNRITQTNGVELLGAVQVDEDGRILCNATDWGSAGGGIVLAVPVH